MNTPQPASVPTRPTLVVRCFRLLFNWRTVRRGLVGLGVLITLIALFYTEEDWRGKRAWENFKRDLEAKGTVLDWNAMIPPAVPDDQNIFKAPKIQEWFVRGEAKNELFNRMDSQTLPEFVARRNGNWIAEVTVVSTNASVAPQAADIVLHYGRVDADIRRQLEGLLQGAMGESTNHYGGTRLQSPLGYALLAGSLKPGKPVRIVVRVDTVPKTEEVAAFLNGPAPATARPGDSLLGLAALGANSFRAFLNSPRAYAASDYLAWSDQFEPDFDSIRAALKRPYARMEGDYQEPFAIPIPRFVLFRILAQTLAQRTKCFLLLGQPEPALRDLTLLHDLSRLLEGKPTGRPMTLVAAMMNVAITGLYVDTIADGLRLQAWREPQLAALEQQLGQVDLLPFVADAFQSERVSVPCMLEKTPPARISDQLILFEGGTTNWWRRLQDPVYTFLAFAPRGWVYQNMIVHVELIQPAIDSIDPANHVIFPGKARGASEQIHTLHKSPYTILESMPLFLPNFIKATQTLARNQTLADEAQTVCALKRYHLAQGRYPESLEALVPQFIDKLPHDIIGGRPLHYRRTDDGRFLLYSVGWNEKDDGGTVAPNRDGREDLENGDWVWQVPK
jgi:hypothetical protein